MFWIALTLAGHLLTQFTAEYRSFLFILAQRPYEVESKDKTTKRKIKIDEEECNERT